jgi:hypothetical protein
MFRTRGDAGITWRKRGERGSDVESAEACWELWKDACSSLAYPKTAYCILPPYSYLPEQYCPSL